jgi:hypothetical protein
MTSLPIILDDLFVKDYQDQIEDCMFDVNWSFKNDNVLGSKSSDSKYRQFVNPLEYDIAPTFIANLLNPSNSKSFEKIRLIIHAACNKINFNIEKIERCYSAIQVFIPNKTRKNTIHVNRDVPHLVLLYYVNDSDGDTILYDKTMDDIPYEEQYPDEYCDLNITHRVTPKKGRVLIFDGRHYHASSSPTKSVRCIITFDLFGNFLDNSYSFPLPKTCKITYS